MRAFAIATGGTYTFLTDHSGIGDSHLEPTIGSYEVEFLNELLFVVGSPPTSLTLGHLPHAL